MSKIKCGVGVIIKKDGMVLVGRRKGSHGDGLLAFPGGHIDDDDNSLTECAKREIIEELGMEIDVVRFDAGREPVLTTFDILSEDGNKRYLTPYLLANYVSGGNLDGNKVMPLEPDKIYGSWFWVSLDELKSLVGDDSSARQWIPIDSLLFYRKQMGL